MARMLGFEEHRLDNITCH